MTVPGPAAAGDAPEQRVVWLYEKQKKIYPRAPSARWRTTR